MSKNRLVCDNKSKKSIVSSENSRNFAPSKGQKDSAVKGRQDTFIRDKKKIVIQVKNIKVKERVTL